MARAASRSDLCALSGPLALVRDRSQRVLGVDLAILRGSREPAVRAGPRARHDARRVVVPGRRAELRRARARTTRRASGAHRALRDARAREHDDHDVCRARATGRRGPCRARTAGRHTGRPRRRVSAEHPRGRRRPARDLQPRRDLVELRPGLRNAGGGRPLQPARSEGPHRGGWVPLRRARLRPRARARGHRERAIEPQRDGRASVPATRRDARADREQDVVGGARIRVGAARVRAAAVRASALGPLHLGHHRSAEGTRPQSGRDPARAPEVDRAASGSGSRRPLLLVHDNGLDDVELRARHPPARGNGGAVRRQPCASGHGHALAFRRGRGRHVLRDVGGVHPGLHEGERRSGPRCAEPRARGRLDRRATVTSGFHLDRRRAWTTPPGRERERRHRPVHRVRAVVPAAAGPRRGTSVRGARREGRGILRGREAGRR